MDKPPNGQTVQENKSLLRNAMEFLWQKKK